MIVVAIVTKFPIVFFIAGSPLLSHYRQRHALCITGRGGTAPTCARAQRTWARQSVHARGYVRARLLSTKVQKLVESKNLQALVM